jgi:hypothetical protein
MTSFPLSDALLGELRAEFPAFRIVDKRQSTLSIAIDGALRLVTLGAQRHFMTRYHTVIGDTLYVCPAWHDMSDIARVVLLRHERVHLRQRRRYGFVPFAILYLVPLFPLGLAYFRARFEWEAYIETLRATAELRGAAALHDPALRRELVRRFVGADYGWMWPFPRTIERWYEAAVSEITTDLGAVHTSSRELGSAGSLGTSRD